MNEAVFATLSSDELSSASGGFKWENLCQSYNVEDRRPGAPRRDVQIRQTDEHNRANGCPTWQDQNPGQPIPTRWGRR
jgi:hypothetical protein